MHLPVVELRDIPLPRLVLVKETFAWIDGRDHSRWLFRTPHASNGDGLFYKIWNPSYLRRDHILRGVESGFYDETTTPALQALIFSRGVCRGYVMLNCTPSRKKDPDFDRRIIQKTLQTGLFAVQYSRFHTMRIGGGLSLIDLEGIHPLDELPDLYSAYHCFFDDREYERVVIDLYRRTYPGRPVPAPTRQPPSSGRLPRPLAYPLRKGRAILENLCRQAGIRVSAVFNHTGSIELVD